MYSISQCDKVNDKIWLQYRGVKYSGPLEQLINHYYDAVITQYLNILLSHHIDTNLILFWIFDLFSKIIFLCISSCLCLLWYYSRIFHYNFFLKLCCFLCHMLCNNSRVECSGYFWLYLYKLMMKRTSFNLVKIFEISRQIMYCKPFYMHCLQTKYHF